MRRGLICELACIVLGAERDIDLVMAMYDGLMNVYKQSHVMGAWTSRSCTGVLCLRAFHHSLFWVFTASILRCGYPVVSLFETTMVMGRGPEPGSRKMSPRTRILNTGTMLSRSQLMGCKFYLYPEVS
jgi:hypothetical protein